MEDGVSVEVHTGLLQNMHLIHYERPGIGVCRAETASTLILKLLKRKELILLNNQFPTFSREGWLADSPGIHWVNAKVQCQEARGKHIKLLSEQSR